MLSNGASVAPILSPFPSLDLFFLFSLSLSLSHTHTHTHTHLSERQPIVKQSEQHRGGPSQFRAVQEVAVARLSVLIPAGFVREVDGVEVGVDLKHRPSVLLEYPGLLRVDCFHEERLCDHGGSAFVHVGVRIVVAKGVPDFNDDLSREKTKKERGRGKNERERERERGRPRKGGGEKTSNI